MQGRYPGIVGAKPLRRQLFGGATLAATGSGVPGFREPDGFIQPLTQPRKPGRCRLQALIESRASGIRIADLMAQMGRIIDAIHSTVPQELWSEILRKIDGPVAAHTPADEIEDGDDAEDEYCPAESARTAAQ